MTVCLFCDNFFKFASVMKPYDREDSKRDQVRDMFDHIAPTYDRLNHLLSMNVDRMWRRRVVRIVRRMHPKRILDVATGTGDLAIAMAERIRGCRILGVDLSEAMLERARRKILARGLDEHITLDRGDAEHLDVGDGNVDVATVAFGVRNFENIEACLREIRRTIREGGALVVLEFSKPDNRMFGTLYHWYFHKILPRVGRMLSHDGAAYEYLPESVDEFPSPDKFAEMLRAAGFVSCEVRSVSFGIAHIYIARR